MLEYSQNVHFKRKNREDWTAYKFLVPGNKKFVIIETNPSFFKQRKCTMYKFSGYTVKLLFGLRGGIKVYQKENLPTDRGFVIACTHEGFVDVLALGAGILPFEIHYMAKKNCLQINGSVDF